MASVLYESSLIAAVAQVIIDRLTTFVKNEVAYILHAEDEFRKLKRRVLKIDALVDCVTSKQQRHCYSSRRAIQLWLCDLQNVLYDADDLLGEIDLELMKLNELSTEDNEGRDTFFSRLRLTVPRDMAEICDRLEGMAREMDGLFMTEVVNIAQPNFVGNIQTSSLVNESSVIGRQSAKDEIKRMLSLKETTTDDISVVSIVGMPGIGKTTLARLVYNDEEVVSHFGNLRVWVSISVDDTVEKITNSILESIMLEAKEFQVLNLDNAQRKLQGVLSMYCKFLIVLDGFWNENASDWDMLFLPFKDAVKGSKILVTTRSSIVSRIVSKISAYDVQSLSDEECWDLMKQRALSCINNDDHRKLEEIGIKIARKCGGLPLAASVIGSILRIKSDEIEWHGVLKSRLWELEYGANDLFSILKLSYDNLPSFLKRCFSYCSIFPHNFDFKRDELVQLWIAEGFIQQRTMRRAEDIGKVYFNVLLSRSLFKYSHTHGGKPVYKMHELIHDIAEFVSEGLCFRMEDEISHPPSNLENVRHLSLLCNYVHGETWEVISRCGRLRTLLLLPKGEPQVDEIPGDIFGKLPYIRVLNLSYTGIEILPDIVGDLKHLRQLNVSGTNIKYLPNSITQLRGLETIKLNDCLAFNDLPEGMRNLTSLRHLELDIKNQIDSMPIHMGKLTSIETLSAFLVANEEGKRIEELKDMSCLCGSICITNLENVTSNREAVMAKLDEKPYLDKLELEWTVTSELTAPEVLGGLRPHSLIKELHISGYSGATFPDWLTSSSFCNLQSICLRKCYNCTVLPFLGHLPMLNSLYIHDMPDFETVDRSFTSSGTSFPSLLELKFANMPKLKSWTDLTNGSMPKLRDLEILGCPILKDLHSLHCLTSLQTLAISHCPEVQFLPNGEFPKSLNSFIIGQCGNLVDRLDWSKIRSISYVELDDQIIQGQRRAN